MKIPKDQQADMRIMLVGMFKKMYKEMIKRNGHNYIIGGVISTTTCFKCM